MTITSLHGDNLDILPTLTPGSVQALICSPPYYGLRSYSIPPSSWPAVEYAPLIGLPPVVVPPMVCQLGAEPDPLAYIGHLVHVFRLARPAMRRDATLWVNLGDSYASTTKGTGGKNSSGLNAKRDDTGRVIGRSIITYEPIKFDLNAIGLAEKNLYGIPARAALALQADGWVWRNDIIWHAPNKMPESVRDRFTRSHEDVLFFGNSARYYFDRDAVAEESTGNAHGGNEPNQHARWAIGMASQRTTLGVATPSTRNRRDVWSIPTTPMPAHLRGGDEAHYAAWPPALVEIMVRAASANRATDIARCVILDPFAGTGTTGAVVESLGRDSILIDLGYQTLQERRTNGIQVTMDALL